MDYKNKRVGFIAAENIVRGDTKTTFGLGYIPFNDKLIVQTVYHGSEAEKMGIKVGRYWDILQTNLFRFLGGRRVCIDPFGVRGAGEKRCMKNSLPLKWQMIKNITPDPLCY